MAKLPGGSVLGGQNLAISSHTDQPIAAQELIEFLTSPYSQRLLFECGGYAATQEIVYFDSGVQREHPYASTLLEAVRTARPRSPRHKPFFTIPQCPPLRDLEPDCRERQD